MAAKKANTGKVLEKKESPDYKNLSDTLVKEPDNTQIQVDNGNGSHQASDDKEEDTAIHTTFEREDKKLLEWMLEHPKDVIKEWEYLLQRLRKKRCGTMGGTYPITLSPLFLKKKSLKLIADVGEKLDQVVDKVVDLYFKDEYVRSYFPYPELPKEWINWDPGYKKPTILNRHDALFDGKNLKFIEFNTDNPGGRGRTDILEGIYRDHPIYKDLIKGYGKPWEGKILKKSLEAMLSCYKEYGGKKEKPRIGIVSFKRYLEGSDNEIVRDYFIENGYESNFIDARELEHRNGALYSGNVQFDILNLALRFTFFKRYPSELKDFLEAIRDRSVCCINPLKAIIGSHKELLSFITNDRNHHYFSEDEVECIKSYVLWTRKMDETITISKEGVDISLEEYVIRKQDELVLKPTDAAGGYGVKIGKGTDKAEWRDAVEDSIGCPWWIVQEAMPVPEIELPVIRENKVITEKKFINLNPYIFKGEYAGMLGRVSESTIVNVCAGGGIIPIFELNEK
jgi:glutathionylspermidine synthase